MAAKKVFVRLKDTGTTFNDNMQNAGVVRDQVAELFLTPNVSKALSGGALLLVKDEEGKKAVEAQDAKKQERETAELKELADTGKVSVKEPEAPAAKIVKAAEDLKGLDGPKNYSKMNLQDLKDETASRAHIDAAAAEFRADFIKLLEADDLAIAEKAKAELEADGNKE